MLDRFDRACPGPVFWLENRFGSPSHLDQLVAVATFAEPYNVLSQRRVRVGIGNFRLLTELPKRP